MFNIDFSLGICLFLFFAVAVVLAIWLFGMKQKDKDLSLNPKFIWFCSICAYTYINTKEEIISVCPRCGSYNKR
ncbi:MAG: hypothetical protein KJ923_03695 [Candidatus Omnitrophica bacterium]|nr:hypothetical protein [Candidatus Omnitrophota bacterium]